MTAEIGECIVSFLLTPTIIAGVKHSSAFVWASVCYLYNSKTNDLKVFKLGTGNDLGIS